jgi:hypothetical protein
MSLDGPRYSADEFERESRYIDNLIWDALVVEPGQRVLFCGYGEDGKWVKRAIDAGANVAVIEHRETLLRRYADLDAKQLRGSTSVIPAKADSFDVAVSFHYLHETDPFFHAQILSELARVAKRIAIVEPGPPADTLGKKIARLYSQAKRELGQFEYYQPLEYWRKLLQSVKADISQHVFAFAKIPPREYLRDTIDLLLRTMEVEDAPRTDLDELRAIARRSDTMILPPPRYVLTGAAVGELPQPIFTPREEPTPTPEVAKAAQAREPVPEPPLISPQTGYEFPPVEPPPQAVPGAAAPITPPAPPTLNWSTWNFAPGAPPQVEAATSPDTPMPFGAPFAMPQMGEAPQPAPFGMPPMPGPPSPGMNPPGWHWEPPEAEDPNKPF